MGNFYSNQVLGNKILIKQILSKEVRGYFAAIIFIPYGMFDSKNWVRLDFTQRQKNW
jgi:hypothetical protein